MGSKNLKLFTWFLLTVFILFFAFDIASDFYNGVEIGHLIFEIFLFTASLAVSIFFAFDYFRTKKDRNELSINFLKSQEKLKEFGKINEAHVRGLSAAIDHVFVEWNLSPSEKEIASLLIKGLSLKEISEIRKSSERTVRTQSASVYEKSGLAGRAELAAYFLEDLLDRSLNTSSNTDIK